MTHQPTFYVHTNVSDWKFGGVITECQIKFHTQYYTLYTVLKICYL